MHIDELLQNSLQLRFCLDMLVHSLTIANAALQFAPVLPAPRAHEAKLAQRLLITVPSFYAAQTPPIMTSLTLRTTARAAAEKEGSPRIGKPPSSFTSTTFQPAAKRPSLEPVASSNRATFETVRAAWQCTHASDASSFSIRSCPAANLIISHCTTDAMRVRIQPSGQRTTGFGIPHSNRSFFIQV